MNRMTAALGGALVLAATNVAAAPGPYAVISMGQTRIDAHASQIDDRLRELDFSSATTRADDRDTGLKVLGGYRVNDYLAVEGGYVEFGDTSLETATTGPPARLRQKSGGHGFTLEAVASLPVTERFRLFAKLGGVYWDAQSRFHVLVDGVEIDRWSDSATGTDWVFGAGASLDVHEHLAVRLEYERYRNVGDPARTGQSDVDFLSAGLVISF